MTAHRPGYARAAGRPDSPSPPAAGRPQAPARRERRGRAARRPPLLLLLLLLLALLLGAAVARLATGRAEDAAAEHESTAHPKAAPAAAARAGDGGALRQAVREYRRRHEVRIVRELAALVALPNLASDLPAIRRNAEAVAAMLRRRGIEARLLTVPATGPAAAPAADDEMPAEGATAEEAGGGGRPGGGPATERAGRRAAGQAADGAPAGVPPVVYGELRVPGARHTVVLYAHYDGQPVDPAEWHSPPWRPVLRTGPLPASPREVDLAALADTAAGRGPLDGEWRLFGRAASDDKAPIVAMLAALDAVRAAGGAPAINVKFVFEGEEEAGSPHLAAILARHRELLAADAWLLADGPVHPSRRPQVVFGARGVLPLGITTYGPVRALHSGHYGNWAPNPAALLVELLAGLRGPDGSIRVAGFEDEVRPLTAAERQAIAALPPVEEGLRRELGLAASERPGEGLEDAVMRPALNFDGLRSAQVGALARNAVPTEATANLDFRLVPDQTPARVRARVEEHLRRAGYTLIVGQPDPATRRAHPRLVRLAWGSGYPGARTPMDLPVARAVLAAADEAAGAPVVRMPMLGGSIPMYLFTAATGAPVILLPTVNHDNSQHAADENLRLQNLWDGIELFANLYTRLEAHWPAPARP
jgi:acetylornithine deacetylase/succinyl-diaminopimelate desuccinylase-like protein